MIRHIAKRGDLDPLWRFKILHLRNIIIRLLRWVENNRRSLPRPSLHGTQGRDSTGNLFDAIHCLLEFSLLFLLIQTSFEINEAFVLTYCGLVSMDLRGHISRNSGCSNTLVVSLWNVLVRKVGCLQRREPSNNLTNSFAWWDFRPTIRIFMIELRTWWFTGFLQSLGRHS